MSKLQVATETVTPPSMAPTINDARKNAGPVPPSDPVHPAPAIPGVGTGGTVTTGWGNAPKAPAPVEHTGG